MTSYDSATDGVSDLMIIDTKLKNYVNVNLPMTPGSMLHNLAYHPSGDVIVSDYYGGTVYRLRITLPGTATIVGSREGLSKPKYVGTMQNGDIALIDGDDVSTTFIAICSAGFVLDSPRVQRKFISVVEQKPFV